MECIILLAGYATRLFPLTENFPKSLLTVADKTILQYILENVERVTQIETVYLVTNNKYNNSFIDWLKDYKTRLNIIIDNDGSNSNEDRLGAIGDLEFIIKKRKIDDDILVLAGDNIFDFELHDFVDFFNKRNECCITIHEIENIENLKKTGVAKINEDGLVEAFWEKPNHPPTNLAVPPVYIFTMRSLLFVSEYLFAGNSADAPGNYIPWLIKKNSVYAYKFNGTRYDIGTLENYYEINRKFTI